MATMHYLFFGILSVSVLFLGGFGHCALERQIAGNQPTSLLMGATSRQEDRIEKNRKNIVDIAIAEIGVREATGHNDGWRVEEYLAYTGLGKGHAWCAAFASWCYGKAGFAAPRNAWSPALFPMARRYTAQQIGQGSFRLADLFAIYNQKLRRIDHVGIVRKKEDNWIVTVEGNADNRVLCKRRPLATIYAFSNWLD